MDIRDCIGFTGRVIAQLPDITPEKRIQYDNMLASVDTRLNDTYLNVAVIGDFSTGKSTFINALTGRNMLKTAWVATTAVPTKIYYHRKKNTVVAVDTADGEVYNLSLVRERKNFEKYIGMPLPEDAQGLITFLTTRNDLSEKIRLVRIFSHIEAGLKDICIIDTPGVNPGADETKKHVMATRNILREYADSTIILFQAQNVYTNSFRRFLQENAGHFINDAVFVITMMDVVDEDERAEIISFVRQCLKDTFGLENPMVYGCCAKYVNDENVSEENRHWCDGFLHLRKRIFRHINGCRSRIIRKQMSELMIKLLEELKKDIGNNLARVSKQLEILNENSIGKLDEEMAGIKERYVRETVEAFDELELYADYNEMFDRIADKAEQSIKQCTKIRGNSESSVSGYIDVGLPSVISKEQEALSRRIEEKIAGLNSLIKCYYIDNKKLFEKYSINLKQKADVFVESEEISYEQDFGEVNFHNSGVVYETTKAIGEVAFVIATFPAVLIDDLLKLDISRTLENALGSATIGLVNLFGDLPSKKRRSIENVRKALDTMRENNRGDFGDKIEKRKAEIIGALNEIEQNFYNEYSLIYEKRKKAFDRKERKIKKEVSENEAIHKKMNEYLIEIKEEGF